MTYGRQPYYCLKKDPLNSIFVNIAIGIAIGIGIEIERL